MKHIPYFIIVAVCAAVFWAQAHVVRRLSDDIHQMSEDINAIRKTLAPFPISAVPAERDNAEWRGEVKQEVSLL